MRKDAFIQMREDLLDPALIPLDAPRYYIYSMGDRLVPGYQVEHHLEDAREKGVKNITIHEDNAAHVSHLRNDPAGYWDSVRKLWFRK